MTSSHEALKAALKPFADAVARRPWLESTLYFEFGGSRITNRDLHRAAEAYAALEAAQPMLSGGDVMVMVPKEVERLKGVIEHDRSKVADILAEANAVLKGYWWLAEGRGSYAFDDDRWKDEFKTCMEKLVAVFDPMRVIAGDLSDSPIKWADIVAARALSAIKSADAKAPGN